MTSEMETSYRQDDIAQAATAELANSPVSELRELRVDGAGSHLELSGQVRSYYHKQLAQETVRAVAGNMQVVNLIDVLT